MKSTLNKSFTSPAKQSGLRPLLLQNNGNERKSIQCHSQKKQPQAEPGRVPAPIRRKISNAVDQTVDIVTSEPLPPREQLQDPPRPDPAPPAALKEKREEVSQEDRQTWQAAGMGTGFPVPTNYAATRNDGYDFFGRSRVPLARRPPGALAAAEDDAATKKKPVLPVFRASPYRAEINKQRSTSSAARILFVDEGNTFRSILAAALFRLMLSKLRSPLDIVVESASIGPATIGQHDPRVMAIAREMGLQLEPRRSTQFDEVSDAVNCDMVVVMDSFDYQEILKEVAVLDTINPNGHYSARIRLLGPFGMAAKRSTPNRVTKDIQDTLYGIADSVEAERAAVRATAKELAFACRGLVDYLLLLRQKCGKGVGLRMALAQSLQCPLLEGGVMPGRDRLSADFRPVWREELPPLGSTSGNNKPGEEVEEYFTIRVVNGERRVVRKRYKHRGYWRNIETVELELRQWMERHGVLDRLPTQQELRKGGASSLASAVDQLGGLGVFSARIGISLSSRKPNGYWDDFEHLAQELKQYLVPLAPSKSTNTSSSSDFDKQISTPKSATTNKSSSGSSDGSVGFQLIMPTQQQLIDAGRADLLRAVRQHGGSAAVARRLGVTARRSKIRTEQDVLEELSAYAKERDLHIMPSKIDLESDGRTSLAHAIHRLGGFKHFSQLAGLEFKGTRSSINQAISYKSKSGFTSEGSSDEDLNDVPLPQRPAASTPPVEPIIESVGRQVLAWLEESNAPRQMPTHQQLLKAGREDLWVLVQRCGGAKRLAEHLDLAFVETRGRRAKSDGDKKKEAPSVVGDARQEIDLVDAYEEFVLI